MQGIDKNSKNSTRMSLLLVPAITIGLSLLGYQTYVWVAGETFNGFSFDIGRLWSTDVKSEEKFDQIENDIFNTKISCSI